MATTTKKPGQVKFGFKWDEGYRLIPVNGVWGGPTPRGDIKVDFFYETYTVPTEVTNRLTPSNQVGEVLEQKVQQDLQRTVLVGMMLTLEQADSIGHWLQEKAQEMRATQEALKEANNESPDLTTH